MHTCPSKYSRPRAIGASALFFLCVWGFAVVLEGCSDPIEPENRAPVFDAEPTAPLDGATDQEVLVTLEWECSDPENNSLTYDIYMASNGAPGENDWVKRNHQGTSYAPSELRLATTYHWKIEAKDGKGNSAVSSVWTFSTRAGAWNRETNMPAGMGSIGSVWANSANDVFAAGWSPGSPSQPAVLHFNGNMTREWVEISLPFGYTGLPQGIWGSGPDSVFVVIGNINTTGIYRYNSVGWRTMELPVVDVSPVYSIWGFSGTNVFAGGDDHILHYNGNPDDEWTIHADNTGGIVRGIWGSPSGKVFGVGSKTGGGAGIIRYYNGTSWSGMSHPSTWSLDAVWGSSESDVFAVGSGSKILHYDGQVWSEMDHPYTTDVYRIYGVWGSSWDDVFAVGTEGVILRYNGSSWTAMSSGSTEALFAVWGSSGNDVYATGMNGTILNYRP